VARLTASIAHGAGEIPELVDELQKAHRARQALATQLQSWGEGTTLPRVDWRAVERRARQVLAEWRSLLTRQISEARPLLRALLEGRRLAFTPVNDVHQRGYRFEGDAGVGGLLEGTVFACRGGWRPWCPPVGTKSPAGSSKSRYCVSPAERLPSISDRRRVTS
jgi:hypothetical protein